MKDLLHRVSTQCIAKHFTWPPYRCSFPILDVMDDLHKWVNPKTNKHSPMISPEIHSIIMKNADVS